MGDFDYLGDLELGASITPKRKKRRQILGWIATTAAVVLVATAAYGVTQIRGTNSIVPTHSKQKDEASLLVNSSGSNIDMSRGSYKLESPKPATPVSLKKVSAKKKKASANSTPSPTPTDALDQTSTSEIVAIPAPKPTPHGVLHTYQPPKPPHSH